MTATLATPGADARAAVLGTALAIVDFYTPTREGFCGGCLEQWARLAPVRCEPFRWAIAVIETHGVAEWDGPGST